MGLREIQKKRRQVRIRKKVQGTALRPRLCVFRSLNNVYAQLIDDALGHTLVSASSLNGDFKDFKGHRGNKAAAAMVGGIIAKKAVAAGIKKAVFDRAGYLYHGSVEALAKAAREAGLDF